MGRGWTGIRGWGECLFSHCCCWWFEYSNGDSHYIKTEQSRSSCSVNFTTETPELNKVWLPSHLPRTPSLCLFALVERTLPWTWGAVGHGSSATHWLRDLGEALCCCVDGRDGQSLHRLHSHPLVVPSPHWSWAGPHAWLWMMDLSKGDIADVQMRLTCLCCSRSSDCQVKKPGLARRAMTYAWPGVLPSGPDIWERSS